MVSMALDCSAETKIILVFFPDAMKLLTKRSHMGGLLGSWGAYKGYRIADLRSS
jgi:hypothetical protein